MPIVFHPLFLFALVAAATPVEWVYITEYTTVYPTPTLYNNPNIADSLTNVTPISLKRACAAPSNRSHGNSSTRARTSTVNTLSSPSFVSSGSTWIQYGSELPGSATPSLKSKVMSPPPASLEISQASIVVVYSSSSLARSFVWPKPTSLSPSSTPSTKRIWDDVPIHGPAPCASSSIVYSRSTSAVTSSAYIPIAPSPSQRTMSNQQLLPSSRTSESSTAVVIVPITLTQPLAAMNVVLPRGTRPPIDLGQANDEPRVWKRKDATPEVESEIGDEYSTTTSTTTLETTITTDKLPTSRTSRNSSKPTRTIAKVSKTSMCSAASRTSSSVSSSALDRADATPVLSTHGRCLYPYPYPKQSCRAAMTTLASRRKMDQSTTTKKKTRPEASKWCPYPGQWC